MQDEMTEIIKLFFEKLNINIDSININQEKSNIFNIKIKTTESWLVIWQNWKNLDAIQNILRLIISKKICNNLRYKEINNNENQKIRIQLEINDYIKTKDDRLFDFIKNEISHIEKTWKDIKLPFFFPYERKKIHSFVHKLENKSIYTKSIWEWKERRLYICKETPKLSIDIDWDDI